MATPFVKVSAVAVPKLVAAAGCIGDRRVVSPGTRRRPRKSEAVRTGVAGRRVPVGVEGRDGEVVSGSGARCVRGGREVEARCGSRVDREAGGSTSDGAPESR